MFTREDDGVAGGQKHERGNKKKQFQGDKEKKGDFGHQLASTNTNAHLQYLVRAREAHLSDGCVSVRTCVRAMRITAAGLKG